jgi:serine/threonine protein kinase
MDAWVLFFNLNKIVRHSNVLLQSIGDMLVVKLADFGSLRRLRGDALASTTLTHAAPESLFSSKFLFVQHLLTYVLRAARLGYGQLNVYGCSFAFFCCSFAFFCCSL